MATIRINQFGGVQPNVDAAMLPNHGAQVAHNCLLTDGSLRPMPQWVQMATTTPSITAGRANTPYTAVPGYSGIVFNGPPFGRQTIYLSGGGQVTPNAYSYASGTISITPGGLSKKPISRLYGVTSVRVIGGVSYESALSVLSGTVAQDVLYEGDMAYIVATCSGDFVRIYRSTSDVTTGGGANGAVTANWQLVVDKLPSGGQFIDGGSAVSDPMDTYLYRGSLRQPFAAQLMGLLESGHVWLVSSDGQIALSDKFMWGVWPVENIYSLANAPGESGLAVTGAVSVGDQLYIGTQLGCYIAEAHVTEGGTVALNIAPIAGSYACLPNTMVASASGAIYTSAQGVVALSGTRAQMLSRSLALGSAGTLPDGSELRFSQINQAFYHNGRYYAFGGNGG